MTSRRKQTAVAARIATPANARSSRRSLRTRAGSGQGTERAGTKTAMSSSNPMTAIGTVRATMTVGLDRGLEKGEMAGDAGSGRVGTAAAAGRRTDLAGLGRTVR
jgi:hypothetical protein